jgi:pimeloyl-ACP methyl ester carboxylesterase
MADHIVPQTQFVRSSLTTQEGVHLAYWIGQPKDYRVDENYRRTGNKFSLALKIDETSTTQVAVKGSVILLHPMGENGAVMTLWGMHFSSAGYVVVMPDLRGHGGSQAAPLGFGPREAADIADLVRQLRASRQLPGPLYLFGVSYGASVSLYAADVVPDVRAVVALEPFGNVAETIERAPRSEVFGHPFVSHWIATPWRMRQATARAGAELGLDLGQLDTRDAIGKLKACALVIRGDKDALTTDAQMRAMVAGSVWASYANVPGEGHMTLPLRSDVLFDPLLKWMEENTSGGLSACPTTPELRTPVT